MPIVAPDQIVVVTGASSGIGAATAWALAEHGFHVLAGVRRLEDADAISGQRIEPIILDITEADHIAALVRRLETDPEGRTLRSVVNNAGTGANAPVEVFPLAAWRRLFEVNYFGHVAIRREVGPLGVDVVVIEPGAVKTRISGRAIATANEVAATMTPEQHRRYDALVTAVTSQAAEADATGIEASRVAAVIVEAITARRPRTRYAIGNGATAIAGLRLLPDRLVDRLLAYVLRRQGRSQG